MNWQTVRLGDIAGFLSGGTPSMKKLEYWGGNIPWVSAKDLKGSRINDSILHLTEEGALNGTKLVPENTILCVVRGMSLANEFRISLSNIPVTFNQDLKAICPYKGVDPIFLFYTLFARRNHIKQLAGEASHGTKKLPTEVLQSVEIKLPDLSVQQQIASIASSYDDLVENNRRRIQLLEQSARLLYKEWFVRLRFPGHEHVKIKDGVPEGWEKIPLGDVLMLQRGFDLPLSARKPGETPIIASTGVNGFHSEAKVCGPGVVTGRSGSLGKVIYVQHDYWPLNTTLWVKEFKKVFPLMAYFLLSCLKLEQYNGGAAVPTLNRNDVHKIETLCPPKRIQLQFIEFVLPLYEKNKVLEKQISRLAGARDIILPRLMSGEIEI
jgi:type I restriction enzyme, S subunit